MIRINLLPIRAAKKRESLRFHITVAGLMLVMVLVASVGYAVKLGGDVSLFDGAIKNAEKELATIERQIGELTNLKHEKSLVQNKLDTVDDLEKGRAGPVRIFNMIRDSLPKKVWVEKLVDKGNYITVSGVAGDGDFVSEFIERIGYTEGVRSVVLKVIKSSPKSGRDMVTFTIEILR
ncbi:MAG: PilN domain-containing protein [Deltaproteobacteria bacterium]|nr:PilN domain-containing protein [Deltaproteobacteria bacterium]